MESLLKKFFSFFPNPSFLKLYYVRKIFLPLLSPMVFKLVDILGVWRYPSDFDPEQNEHKLLNKFYREFKRSKPIIKPEKDSGLEVFFAENRSQVSKSLLPDGFIGEKSVAISAVGDLMNASAIENSADKFYKMVSELIFNPDISIANLESTLTTANLDSKYQFARYQINATPEQFNAFKGHKGKQYTVFCTANNHMFDRGLEGFNTTHDQLDAEGFFYVGTNRSPKAQEKGLILTSNGIKIGLVAATYKSNRPLPRDKDYLINVIPFHRFRGKVNLSLLEKQISFCHSQNCDFIIVSLHWGMEFEFYPRQEQLDIAHNLSEYGADAIISHHTHNIQPYEVYQTVRDSHRRVPILYGLGNLSSTHSEPYTTLSLIANFDIVKGHINGTSKTLVSRINLTPVVQTKHEDDKKPYIQIEKLSDLVNSKCFMSKSKHIDTICKYADLIIGRSWRT